MTNDATQSEAEKPPKSHRAYWWSLIAVLALIGLAAVLWWARRPVRLPEGISDQEYVRAERQFRKVYGRDPDRIDVLSLLGELAVRDGRLRAAAACFREIPPEDSRYGPSATLQQAQVLLRLNQAEAAELSFRKFLALAAADPSIPQQRVAVAYKWLTYILSVELRLEERKSLLAAIHARGQADLYDSKQYYFPNLLIWHSTTGRQRLKEFIEADPDNPQLRVALGRYHTTAGRLNEARSVLEATYRQHPDDLRCAAALLECHFERTDWPRFLEVAKSLPDYARDEPWLLTRMRGRRALHKERWEDAVRCFESVLQADPANPSCYMALAEAYKHLQQPEKRQTMLRKALELANIRVSLTNVTPEDPAAVKKLAADCAEIGLEEAAETFRRHAVRIRRARQAE